MKCLLTYGVITHFTYKEEMSNIQSDYLFFLFFKLGDISTDMVPTEASPDQSKIYSLLFRFMSYVKQLFGVIGSGQTV